MVKKTHALPSGWKLDPDALNGPYTVQLIPDAPPRPMSVAEIKHPRPYFISARGNIHKTNGSPRKDMADLNNLSSRERAEAFLALMQLVELRDAWAGPFSRRGAYNYGIVYVPENLPPITIKGTVQKEILIFPNRKMAEDFAAAFSDLIETAAELLAW